jgi:tetrahydromethanopterin S-methyltransferase subunit F
VTDQQTSEIAKAVQEVTERAQLIIREEVELAKLEVTTKVSKLAKGAAIGAAAGVFVLAGLIYFLHAVSWFVWKLVRGDGTDNFYLGFLIVAGALFLLGGLAGFIAARLFKKGSSPVPSMAIEEAQLVRQTFSSGTAAPGPVTSGKGRKKK